MNNTVDDYPKVGNRSEVDHEVLKFLRNSGDLCLGKGDFTAERSHHSSVLALHNIPSSLQEPIHDVEFAAIRGPIGTVGIRVLYPESGKALKKNGQSPALIYMHGGGYSVGSADEFENGLRIISEMAAMQVYIVDYHLAPEWKYPAQLEEYAAVFTWLRGPAGQERGVNPERIYGGGDSAGGNMTAALAMRTRDWGGIPFKGLILLYPETRAPFDTPAADQNNTGFYLECNGIFSFVDHYLPRGISPNHPYVSPGTQPPERLHELPPTIVITCGYDPLRDVGIEFARKLSRAGNKVVWNHYSDMLHGFLQFVPWSSRCKEALRDVAATINDMVHR